jgi:hypothetical protein
MILHWLTTAWRSLIANPLFSLITIASLSIGCAGALLAGSLIRQHLTFDNWIPHAQSIGLVRYHWSNRYSAEGKLRSPRIEPAEDFYYIETIDATQGKLQGVIAQTGVVQQTLYNDDA